MPILQDNREANPFPDHPTQTHEYDDFPCITLILFTNDNDLFMTRERSTLRSARIVPCKGTGLDNGFLKLGCLLMHSYVSVFERASGALPCVYYSRETPFDCLHCRAIQAVSILFRFGLLCFQNALPCNLSGRLRSSSVHLRHSSTSEFPLLCVFGGIVAIARAGFS